MQITLLKNIAEDIAGKQAEEIVDLLIGKKDVNEFLIAKKMKLTINQVRNMLYKLSDKGLVSFTRKKDKRKGWYIYFWTLNSLKSLTLLEKKLSEEFDQLEKQLKNRKTKRFYSCKICNIEVSEGTALLNQFTCPECGQVYVLSENNKLIKELENKINKSRKSLELIRGEKGKIMEKEEKSLRRKEAREKKEAKKKKKTAKKKVGKKVGKKAKKKTGKKVKEKKVRKEKKKKPKTKKIKPKKKSKKK